MVDFDPPPHRRDERLRRYAAAITQAEIRRLSRPRRLVPVPRPDATTTVQRELRRLSHPDASESGGDSRAAAP